MPTSEADVRNFRCVEHNRAARHGAGMSAKTIYGVQPYWHDGRRLARGLPEQFRSRDEADKAAERLYMNHAGVLIYSVTGNPEFDTWGEPRVLWTIGYCHREP